MLYHIKIRLRIKNFQEVMIGVEDYSTDIDWTVNLRDLYSYVIY